MISSVMAKIEIEKRSICKFEKTWHGKYSSNDFFLLSNVKIVYICIWIFRLFKFWYNRNKWLLNLEPLFFLSHCQGLPNVLRLDSNHPSSNIDTAQCCKKGPSYFLQKNTKLFMIWSICILFKQLLFFCFLGSLF